MAQAASYSRATVYVHWPTRIELARDALSRLGEVAHVAPTGDLRHDLDRELRAVRTAVVEHGLGRALTLLDDLAHTAPELTAARDARCADAECGVRRLLEPVLSGADHEAAVAMLLGAVLHRSGEAPAAVLSAAVELTLRAAARSS